MSLTTLTICKSTRRFVTAAIVVVTLAVTGGTASGSDFGFSTRLIQLPVGEMTNLTYDGEEYHYDNNNNGIPDEGDVMEGIAVITGIRGVDSNTDYSHQLSTREITVAFRFTITAGSIYPEGHIDFSLVEGDFFRIYVGSGQEMNYDPLAVDAWERAADGTPWISMEPSAFFESVNDVQSDGSTLNRTWANLATNQTGYVLVESLFPTRLGFDPSHVFDGQPRGDIPAQLYFENFVDGASANPDYTFAISGHFYIEAVPEESDNPYWAILIQLAKLLVKLLLSLL